MNSTQPVRRSFLQRRKFTMHPLSLAVLMSLAGPAAALPTGSTVVSGQVTVQNQSSTLQIVTQGSQRGVIDWKSFSIASGETVRFNQPSTSAVLLNRVTGYDPSSILGQMQSNGRIFLLNPHGIVFGSSARVDVGGMVASTLSLSNADFNAGKYQLTSAAGEARGAVRNDGFITASGGTVALVAPTVENRGTIEATGGRVGMAAANSVLVDVEGDGLIFFNASATEAKNRLEHLGRIQADGGTVDMRAAARGSMADTVLNLSGVVQARSLSSREGQVFIDGGDRGITAVRGSIDVSGTDAGEMGGTAKVLGNFVGLFDQARIDASGNAGGGTVMVGGNFQGKGTERNARRTFVDLGVRLEADAVSSGDGGRIIVWADDVTRYHGTLSAQGGATGGDGGFAEVSGKNLLQFHGRADVSADKGALGTILLDPRDITVVAGNGNPGGLGAPDRTLAFADLGATDDVNVGADLLASLAGNVDLQATRNLTISAPVTLTTVGASFTGRAGNDIALNAGITTRGGDITLTANDVGAGVFNAGQQTGQSGTGRIFGTGALTSSATVAGGAAGTITLSTSGAPTVGVPDGGSISVGPITAVGAAGAAGATGGSGGAVVITAGAGVTVGAITTTGGVGGNSANDGGTGGAGGRVSITATGNVDITAAIEASGGQGGNAGGGGGDTRGNGGNAADFDEPPAGGATYAVQIVSSAGAVTVAGINAAGGAQGAAGNQAGNDGNGGNIVLSAGTDLTVGGIVTSSTVGANRTVSFNVGTAGLANQPGGTLTLGGTTIEADAVEINGGAGNDTLSFARNVATITLGAATLGWSAQAPAVAVAGVESAILRGGNGANTITVTNWAGTARIDMTLGADVVNGTDNAASADARTTLLGLDTGVTFTIAGGNDGSTAGAGTTTFNNVGKLVGGSGTNVFSVVDGGSILGGGSITGGSGDNTLSLATRTTAVPIVLGSPTSSVTGIVAAFSGIDTVAGNGAQSTLTGVAGGQLFTITGTNTGTAGTLAFSGVANLAGAAGDDTFSFQGTGSVTSIAGAGGTNTLRYNGYTGGTSYNLQGNIATGVTNAVTGVTVLVGDGATTTLLGANAAEVFEITGVNAGNVGAGAFNFTGVGSLNSGQGNDTITGTAGSLGGSIVDAVGTTTLNGTITTTGSQTYTGAVILGSNVSLTSGITGNNAAVTFGNSVSATDQTLSIQTQGVTTFTGDAVGFGSLTTDVGGTTVLPALVRTSGNLRIQDAAQGGEVTLRVTTGGNVLLGEGSNLVKLSLEVAGSTGVTVFDADSLELGATTIAGAGPIAFTVGQSLSRTTPLTLGAVPTIAVGEVANVPVPVDATIVNLFRSADAAFGAVAIDTGTAAGSHDVTITGAAAPINLNALTVSGDLLINSANQPVGQAGALRVDGSTTINSGTAAVTLSNPANDFVGAVSITNTNSDFFSAVLADVNAIDLGPITLGAGRLEVYAGGDITQSGAIVQVGVSPYAYFTTTGGRVELLNPANDFTGTVYLQGPGSLLGVRDANDLTVDLFFFVNGTNTGVAAIAGGSLNLLSTPVGFSTGTGAINLQALGGPLTLAPGTTFTTTSGDITLASQGDLTVSGVSTTSGNLSFNSVAGNLSLSQPVTTNGNLQVQAGLAITQAAAITVGGTLSGTAGSVSLSNSGNAIGSLGAFTTTTGAMQITDGLSGLNVTGNLSSAGDVTISANGLLALGNSVVTGANISVGGIGVTSTGGSVTGSGDIQFFGTSGGSTGAVTLAGPVTTTGAGNSIGVFAASAVSVGNLTTTGTGGVVLGAGFPPFGVGSVTQTGVINTGTLTSSVTGSLTLNGNNTITEVSSLFASNGISLNDLGGLNVTGSVDAGAGALSLTTTGALALGSQALAGTGVALNGAGITSVAGGSVNAGAGTLLLDGGAQAITLGGSLQTTNATASALIIRDASALALNGSVSAASGTATLGAVGQTVGNVTMGGGASLSAGTLVGNSTGAVTLTTNVDVGTLGAFSSTGAFSLSDSGGLAVSGPVSGAGVTLATSGGTLALNGSVNGNAGTVSLSGSSGITQGAGSVVNTSGALSANSLAGSVTLGQANTVASLGASSAAGNFTLVDAGGLAIGGNLTVGGTASLTTSGNVTQTGTISAATLAVTASAGSVTLAGANTIGTLAASSGASGFTLNDTSGGLTVSGAVGGGTGAVSLTTAGGPLALGASNVTAATGVTLSGVGVSHAGASVNAGSGPLLVDGGGGAVSLNGTLTTTNTGASAVIIREASSVALGNVSTGTGGTTTLGTGGEAVGAITQTGVINTGTLTGLSTGAVTLAGNNNIDQLGAFSASGFVLNDAGGGLTVNGTVNAGTGSLSLQTAGGALALGASDLSSNAAAGSITLRGVGITQSAGGSIAGAGSGIVDAGTGAVAFSSATNSFAGTASISSDLGVSQTGGSLVIGGSSSIDGGSGGIALASTGNDFGGAVTLLRTGGAVSLRDSTDLTVASISAVADQSVTLIAQNDLTVNTGGLLAIGTGVLTLQAINGVLTLTGDVGANLVDFTADAISLAGTITTIGNQTYTGLVTLLGDLSMVAGGAVDIQAGASGTGNFAVTATQGITLGDAGPVAVTVTGSQIYNSAVVLGSNVTLTAGAAGVTLNGTVDGTTAGTQSLTVNTAGATTFNQRVGGTTALATLTTNAGGSTVFAGGGTALPFVTTTGDQTYNDAAVLSGDTVFRANKVTFNSTFNGGTSDVEFRVTEQTAFVGAITSSGGIILSPQTDTEDISVAVDTGGLFIDQATLNSYADFGRVVLGNGNYDGEVRLGNVLLPNGLEVNTLTGDVLFNGSVNSAATAQALTVNAGGLASFNGVVGGTGALASLDVSGATLINTSAVTTTGAQTYGGNVSLGAAVDPTLSAQAIDITGQLATGARNLTLFADAIDIGSVATGTGILQVAGRTQDTAIGIATADIAGRLDISQSLLDKLGEVDDVVIGRNVGTATITANAFTLPADLSLRSGSGNIRFNGTVNSGAANQALEIDTTGTVTFLGAVGGANAGTSLTSLSVSGATAIDGGSVRTSGAQLYEDNATLGANTTLTGSAVTFAGTVDGARALVVNAGATVFGAAVGGGTQLSSLTTDAGGTVQLQGAVRTTGNQVYGDAVQLNADTALSGARVTVNGSIDGAHALQINAAGGVALNGDIGGTATLDSLQVTGPTTLDLAVVSTSGAQRYTGPVTLAGAATTLSASALDFSGAVDGASLLTLQVAGLSTFGGNVGASTALSGLDSQGDGAVQLLGSSIRTSGAQSYNGALQVSGDTVLTAGSLTFSNGLTGAGNLLLRTDALEADAAIDGDGVLTISQLTQGRTIGIAGGAGDLQIAQSVLNGATNFSRHVIGRADGTGAINAGNTRLTADTRLFSATGDIRLNGSVDGGFNLQLDTGGTTRIAGPVGALTPLISLTTDNAAAADWNGTTGERTLFDAGGGRARVITVGDQTYNDPLVNTVPVALSGAIITAQNVASEFGTRLPDGTFSARAIDVSGQTLVLRSGQTIELGNVTLTNGGSVETGGVLRLSGALLLEGGTLLLTSTATPTALTDFTDPELQGRNFSVGLVPVREASATIEQTETSTISSAADTLLVLRSTNGGSMKLDASGNTLLGEVSAVSGVLGDSNTARFDGPDDILAGFIRLNSTQIRVAGAPPTEGDQAVLRAGIESDVVWLRADGISTGLAGQIRARLPFNNFQGSSTSVPGLTLVMSEAALANGGGFGGNSEESWIQVRVGDERGGFLTVRPKGENGPNAFILLGGEVTAQPFYDGAGKVTEVRVFYNGATPRTAQESGALSAVQAVAEEARQSRFEEAVRTENVRARLRSGVIAEVGAGRPATVGAEGIRQPENCEVKGSTLQCQ